MCFFSILVVVFLNNYLLEIKAVVIVTLGAIIIITIIFLSLSCVVWRFNFHNVFWYPSLNIMITIIVFLNNCQLKINTSNNNLIDKIILAKSIAIMIVRLILIETIILLLLSSFSRISVRGGRYCLHSVFWFRYLGRDVCGVSVDLCVYYICYITTSITAHNDIANYNSIS